MQERFTMLVVRSVISFAISLAFFGMTEGSYVPPKGDACQFQGSDKHRILKCQMEERINLDGEVTLKSNQKLASVEAKVEVNANGSKRIITYKATSGKTYKVPETITEAHMTNSNVSLNVENISGKVQYSLGFNVTNKYQLNRIYFVMIHYMDSSAMSRPWLHTFCLTLNKTTSIPPVTTATASLISTGPQGKPVTSESWSTGTIVGETVGLVVGGLAIKVFIGAVIGLCRKHCRGEQLQPSLTPPEDC